MSNIIPIASPAIIDRAVAACAQARPEDQFKTRSRLNHLWRLQRRVG